MKSVCLCFSVHLPQRLRKYEPGDIDIVHAYEHTTLIRSELDAAADNCYLPANEMLCRLIEEYGETFAVSFSFSGIMLDMLRRYRPDVLQSFQQLVNTGQVDILAETYYNSLSFLHSGHEFKRQVEKHTALVEELFGITPVVFRNTEFIYNNDLARIISSMGYKGVLCEGAGNILQGRSTGHLYAPPFSNDFAVMLRHSSLSDDIAFRFDDEAWTEYPLTAEKFATWFHALPAETELTNLFMHYETLGLHKKASTGIFTFFENLPGALLAENDFVFSAPCKIVEQYKPREQYNVPDVISWQACPYKNGDHCANSMQHNTLKKIYAMENMVVGSGNNSLMDTWGMLQAADHFYYMTNAAGKASFNHYENPFDTADEAFRNYANILVDFEISVIRENIGLARQRAMHDVPVFNLY